MICQAKEIFDSHMLECRDSIALYGHLANEVRFKADFNLRFVWIAAVSAMDHYITKSIIDYATFYYGNNIPLKPKLLADLMPFSSAIELRSADRVNSIIIFRKIIENSIKYKSFQSPDKISDGLSYIWSQKQKWHYISSQIGIDEKYVKGKLSAIVDRRNVIAHNGDYNDFLAKKYEISQSDAEDVVEFISKIVGVIDVALAAEIGKYNNGGGKGE